MKFILSLVLVIGSLGGMALCFLSKITVASGVTLFNGINLSMVLGIFLVAVFLGGISLMFSNDNL
jgi:hypothetical protein